MMASFSRSTTTLLSVLFSFALFFVSAVSAVSVEDMDDEDDDDRSLLVEPDFTDFGVARTVAFNSTYLLIAIAVGAVLILGIGVALYLYDLFNDSDRADYQQPDYGAYYSDFYQNGEYAYPYAYQQSYRYVERGGSSL